MRTENDELLILALSVMAVAFVIQTLVGAPTTDCDCLRDAILTGPCPVWASNDEDDDNGRDDEWTGAIAPGLGGG